MTRQWNMRHCTQWHFKWISLQGKPVGTPDAGAYFRVLAEHGVAALFTAPTAIRAIRQQDPGAALGKQYSLTRWMGCTRQITSKTAIWMNDWAFDFFLALQYLLGEDQNILNDIKNDCSKHIFETLGIILITPWIFLNTTLCLFQCKYYQNIFKTTLLIFFLK